ncbi:MAG: adenylosuccinate lyase [Anaerolineaceae bacterium]|nr:MAG: adenylosuccinate lyase [Anaerolineaceae bacterium]
MALDFETYQSPFTWRYGSLQLRTIWSEVNKRRLWRRLWLALAEVQAEFGLVQQEQVDNLRTHVDEIDIPRALEIEAEIHHDLMAELKVFAEQARLGGGILHLGATTADITDNADVLRLRQSLDLLLAGLRSLLLAFSDQIDAWADMPLMAFTHIQPAEPSTLGYRLAQYAQDLLQDYRSLSSRRAALRGKGFKGAVGTGASYAELLGTENLSRFESRLSAKLDLEFYPVTTQIYPRKQDYQLISALAGVGGSLYKFAFDLRLMQSSPVGEIGEPFGKKQVGSSAMPFKQNPVHAEKINSLGRALAQMPRLAWDNAAHSLLERTLDDSANRRSLLPEACLITDELLRTAARIVEGLRVNEDGLKRNLARYAPFAAVERVLMALGKCGADRQVMHNHLRQLAMEAWGKVQAGQPNPLPDQIANDTVLLGYLSETSLQALMDVQRYLGDAPQRARAFAKQIHSELLSDY